MMDLGKNISALRRERGVTQEDLAAELGVTAAAVSKWEHGYTLPDILMLCALADYFRVTTDELLGRTKARKYAVIAAETPELGKQIEAMAKDYGIYTKSIHTDYAEAVRSMGGDSAADYLLVGYMRALTDRELEAEGHSDLHKLVSQSDSEQKVLNGMQWVFENCLPSLNSLGK